MILPATLGTDCFKKVPIPARKGKMKGRFFCLLADIFLCEDVLFCMEIISKNLKRCATCKRLRGHIEEKCNGQVIVLCFCDLKANGSGRLPSPSIISRRKDLLTWTPTTNHMGEDGKSWHTPHFAGFGY